MFKPDQQKIVDVILSQRASDQAKLQGSKLVEGWIKHYRDDVTEFKVIDVEKVISKEYDLGSGYKLILVGTQDLTAEGETPFFGEWKSSSARSNKAVSWKERWKFSVQGLTYGLLTDMKRILVRTAFKTNPPSYDQEWYEFGERELNYWKNRIIRIGKDLTDVTEDTGWDTNPESCDLYYRLCPFFYHCLKGDFNSTKGTKQRELQYPEIESQRDEKTIILSATRIKTLLNCEEKYRKTFIMDRTEDEDALPLMIGTCMHVGLAELHRQMRTYQNG